MKNVYTAINIGPIIATFSLAKKPRELWASSYIFSHLMKSIIDEVSQEATLLSPYKEKTDSKIGVGLYPDRAFFKSDSEITDISEKISGVVDKVADQLGIGKDYFNVMIITLEEEHDREAIKKLNRHLDYCELNNKATSFKTEQTILKLIKNQYKSPLFPLAFGKNQFPVGTLAEIATVELKNQNPQVCTEARKVEKLLDELEKNIPEEYKIIDEDNYYKFLKDHFKGDFKSYHKYVCIVQADGDNMGKVVTHLEDGELNGLSEALIDFGKKASEKIAAYGGLPIYAGGDDLLFVAPVVGKEDHIFGLVQTLDKIYNPIKQRVAEYQLRDETGKEITTSMSYGISITYYKYPLYEAWAKARELLFEKAKKVEHKNAIACSWQKHSGSSFFTAFSKENRKLYELVLQLIEISASETMVSAIAHKLRVNAPLLAVWKGEEERHIGLRLNGFFEKIIDVEGKDELAKAYMESVKRLLLELYLLKYPFEEDQKEKRLSSTIFGILRIAKFINGEEVNDGE